MSTDDPSDSSALARRPASPLRTCNEQQQAGMPSGGSQFPRVPAEDESRSGSSSRRPEQGLGVPTGIAASNLPHRAVARKNRANIHPTAGRGESGIVSSGPQPLGLALSLGQMPPVARVHYPLRLVSSLPPERFRATPGPPRSTRHNATTVLIHPPASGARAETGASAIRHPARPVRSSRVLQ
jgi:hypothetical protein